MARYVLCIAAFRLLQPVLVMSTFPPVDEDRKVDISHVGHYSARVCVLLHLRLYVVGEVFSDEEQTPLLVRRH